MANNIGMKQIAEAAGVAVSTVSLVLNNKGIKSRIAPETQERIRTIANEMQYQPVKRKKTTNKQKLPLLIAAFWPMDFESGPVTPFFSSAMLYIREHRLPYEVVLVPYSLGTLSEKAHIITKQYFAAAIHVGINNEDLMLIENSQFDIPTIVINRQTQNCHCVTIDDYDVGQFACKHFLQRGHKKLCIIAPDYSTKSLSLRMVGFLDGLQWEGLGDAVPKADVFRGYNSDGGGYDAAGQMFSEPEHPTAIFVANANMTSGIVRRIWDENKRIPKDIEIIAFGNSRKHKDSAPKITNFEPPLEEISSDCIQILHQNITGANDMRISRHYTARCVFRESCPAEGTFASIR